MGFQDREYYRDDVGPRGLQLALPRSMVGRIILVNVAVFLVDFLSSGQSSHPVEQALAAHPAYSFSLTHFWQFLTAGFVHDPYSIMHLFGNMFTLWFFAPEVEARYGRKEFLWLYLVLLTGTVFGSCLRQRLFLPETQWAGLIGASGGVTAIVIISVLRQPHRTLMLFGVLPTPAWALGAFMVTVDILGALGVHRDGTHRVAYDAHIIGAALGFAYVRMRWNFSWLGGAVQWFTWSYWKGRPGLRIHRPGPVHEEPNLEREADRVLAKLHQEGEASLSRQERKVLEEYSRRLRQSRSPETGE